MQATTDCLEPASIDTIKQELKQLPPKEVLELLLQLTRLKKENKEWLTYKLFEAGNNEGYIDQIKVELKETFTQIDGLPPYQYKKQFRKMQRKLNKPVKYMNDKPATVELYLYVVEMITQKKKSLFIRSFLDKMVDQYTIKIQHLLPAMPEDLAHDFRSQLAKMT